MNVANEIRNELKLVTLSAQLFTLYYFFQLVPRAHTHTLSYTIYIYISFSSYTLGSFHLFPFTIREMMTRMKLCSVSFIFSVIAIQVLHLSTIVNGQQVMDSCNSTLPLEDLALDSSLFQCVEVWSDQNYILRVSLISISIFEVLGVTLPNIRYDSNQKMIVNFRLSVDQIF